MSIIHEIPIEIILDKIIERKKKHNQRKGKMNEFQLKINSSIKYLESLPDGWADYEKNKKFTPNFLKNIEEFLKFIEISIFNRIEFPSISPVDTNSVDIYWNNAKYQLLINIKDNNQKLNTELYGKRKNTESDDEINWHGNIHSLRSVIFGWLLTT